jgi:hypothetical protein
MTEGSEFGLRNAECGMKGKRAEDSEFGSGNAEGLSIAQRAWRITGGEPRFAFQASQGKQISEDSEFGLRNVE